MAVATAAAATLTLSAGGPASAHAAIVSSQPRAGAELAGAPGVVLLRFTEPLNRGLSRAVVVAGQTGQRFEGTASAEREIRIPLRTNSPGVYTVEWTTVSTLDGHTLRGSFRFGVGVSPGAGAEGETGSSPQAVDLWIAAARAVEYTALLLALGMLLVRRLARRGEALGWVRFPLWIPLAVALGSGIAVVVGESLAASPRPSVGSLVDYLSAGLPGAARVVRLALEAAALNSAILGGRVAAIPVGGALAALAAAGHAAAVEPRWWGISVDALHLVSAGLWAGGILALATLRPPGGWRGAQGRALLDRFSAVAIPAFLATVAFGTLRGFQELSGLGDLVSSSYGRVLGLKVLGVLAMVPFSVLAWRRVLGSPRLEAAVALLVVGAAALLAAYPLPPGRLAEAEAAARRPAAAIALPRASDLTLGGVAGETLVGLTLRPGRPGDNEALVYLLPLGGEEAAAGIPARVSVEGETPQPMVECGDTCRRTELSLRGGERVEVEVGGPAGGTAIFDLPELPAEDGTTVFRGMQEAMHDLRTYRYHEVLRPADPPVVSDYAAEAPDRLRIEVSNGFQIIDIGNVTYRRKGSGPWHREPGVALRVPSFIWDNRDPRAFRILGEDSLEGVRTTVVSFFGSAGDLPIWFRLWIDPRGKVRQAEMRAQGHFMDHRYADFDAPLSVDPPAESISAGGP